MGIFSRLSDIINSNLTALLDKSEDPEKMIRLMIHEMNETLVGARASAAKVIADRKEAQRTMGRLQAAQDEWKRKAELAISKDREDLAKGALLEKAKLEETAKYLRDDLDVLDASLSKYEEDIQLLESKLREAKAKQDSFKARHNTAQSRLNVRKRVHDGRIDNAFARFERMERRIDGVESEVESFDLGREKSLSEEIAELEVESAIDKELEALKARAGKGAASQARK